LLTLAAGSGAAAGPLNCPPIAVYYRFKPYQRFDQLLFVVGDGVKWEPVDVGVARFLTTSDGQVVANRRFLDTAHEQIVELQRRRQRARAGSGNRRRVRRALAKEWRKLRNQRRDFHHKIARGLVNSCDTIALENLRVAAMTATASGTVEAPGRNVAAKAESAGRPVIFVNPSSTSIDCHTCVARCVRPRQDIVVGPVHAELDADLDGARNIAIRAGLGSGQAFAA
jgi:putative transposase